MLKLILRYRAVLFLLAFLIVLVYPEYLFLAIGAFVLLVFGVILIVEAVLDLYITVVFVYRWAKERWFGA
ncbi:hypothetical protein [Hydrogenimonas sp.]